MGSVTERETSNSQQVFSGGTEGLLLNANFSACLFKAAFIKSISWC